MDEYTATSLAARARVSVSYVSAQCRSGKLPARKIGTVWLIEHEAGEAWLAQREARGRKRSK